MSEIPLRRERHRYQLKSNRQLREVLGSVADGTLVFHGLWRELTTSIQYALATWTLAGPGRASAVLPVDLAAELPRRDNRRWLAQPDVVLVQPTGNILVRRGTVVSCTDLEALELASDEHSPVALAITGHGAEHCVQFGSLWLCTDPDARLPGAIVDPRDLRSPLVFLNSCASLRMGDSTVPMAHSLSATLFAQGSVVVGSFRNLHTSLDAPRLFVEGLRSGESLGNVLRNVNAAAVKAGAVIPPYQIMGDPTLKTIARPVRLARRNRSDNRNRLVKSTIQAVSENIASTELMAHTIANWFRPSDRLETIYKKFKDTSRYVMPLCHDQVSQSLSTDELNNTLRTGLDAAAALRESLLEELRDKIQNVRWLETCYAPNSHVRISRKAGAGLKTSLIMRHVYLPIGRGMLAVTREDCCARGTLREWLGVRAPGRIEARLIPGAIVVDACPLGQDELGTFFIHRTNASPPVAWPQAGGRVSFAVDELPFKGRVTVVAARIGPRFAHFEYRTLFVPTGSGDDAPHTPTSESIRLS